MNAEDSHSLAALRVRQIPMSLLCLALPLWMIQAISYQKNVAAMLPLTIYSLYLTCAAVIMTVIALRLFNMHGVRRFVFDIPIWFMLSALLALPLAAANILSRWVATEVDAERAPTFQLIAAGCLFFELLPLFFVTEGLVTLAALVFRRWFRRDVNEQE